MRITQYNLTASRSLTLNGEEVATIERTDYYDRINGLRITSKDGRLLDLPGGVDISEQLDVPRVFVIEGVDRERFFVFGGEVAFLISANIKEIARFDLFRSYGEAEYWTTTVLERPSALIIVYEAGVLLIDESLKVLMHKKKLFNDFFVAIDDNGLKFVRDHQDEWHMPLDCLPAS